MQMNKATLKVYIVFSSKRLKSQSGAGNSVMATGSRRRRKLGYLDSFMLGRAVNVDKTDSCCSCTHAYTSEGINFNASPRAKLCVACIQQLLLGTKFAACLGSENVTKL